MIFSDDLIYYATDVLQFILLSLLWDFVFAAIDRVQ